MRIVKNEAIFEELREIGKDLRSEKHLASKQMLMGIISKEEENLTKTLTKEQMELYEKLDKYMWDYVELAEKEAFYHGFEVAKALMGK